jgi:Acyl-CoA dehydrogenase, N-terminal domain
MMNFAIPEHLAQYLQELDNFIETQILPLQMQDDNNRFFDYRREDARTDWERDGLPNEQWEELLLEAKRRADAAGHFRFSSPKEFGGRDGSNLDMAIIREHLATKGLGLHNDLQNEHSIVGNNVGLLLMLHYGTEQQKAEWIDDLSEFYGGHHRDRPRLGRHAHGNLGHARGRHLDDQRRKVLEYRHSSRQPYPAHCAQQRQGGRCGGPDRLSRADKDTGFQTRGNAVDVQYAHRSRPRVVHQYAGARQLYPRR